MNVVDEWPFFDHTHQNPMTVVDRAVDTGLNGSRELVSYLGYVVSNIYANINKLSVHLFPLQCHGETMNLINDYNYAELESELQGTKADEWHSVVGNYIMKKNEHSEEEKKRLEEEKKRLEEKYHMEKQITEG